MDNRSVKADSNIRRDSSGGVTQEQVDAWVASLSMAERLALAADLTEADGRLNGTKVTGMSEDEFDRFLDRF